MKAKSRLMVPSVVLLLLLSGCGNPASDGTATDAEKLRKDLDSLSISYAAGDSAAFVTGSVALPSSGPQGSSFTWASSSPETVAPDGTVVRPANLAGDKPVTLTAHGSLGGATADRSINLTVIQSWDYVPTPASDPEAAAIAGMLRKINYYRWLVGVEPLVWNDTLAATATAWATTLSSAPISALYHDDARATGSGFSYVGENLFGTTASADLANAAVEAWATERTSYCVGRTVEAGSGFLHYSQLVWNGTTDIGIGHASSANGHFVVARFGPGGNYLGMAAYPEARNPWLDQDNDGQPQWKDADDTDPDVK